MNIALMMESQYKAKERAYKNHIKRLRERCYSTNNRLQLIRVSNRKLNCLRWHNNETREHIIKKLEICMELKDKGHDFITEAIFNNGSRADVIDLTEGIIYEVMNSEDEKKFEEKIKRYPGEFKTIKMKI